MNPAQDILAKANELHLDGKINEAIELYKESIRLSPSADAYTYLAWALSSQGKYEEAIEECQKAITINDTYWAAYNDIGTNLYNMEKLSESVFWFEKGLEFTPDELRYIGYYNLGRTYEKQKLWMDAIQYYMESFNNNPEYELAKGGIVRMSTYLN
ncbi:MAG: tetratricopeptide repeat protein [Bacillota bacterium]